ncbi:MAG: NUDIX hydrolase [Clostridia bacterium]|nr:NUDIX hydrolase [Clostridia bacterium]
MHKLIRQLRQHIPWNEQEARDLPLLLYHLENSPDIFIRNNGTVHFTASAWVVSPDRRKVLMAYHNLYRSWAWLGGHADGETDLSRTAMREAGEESGLERMHFVTPDPLSVEILTVNGHEKKGVYVPSHLHLNVTYLLEADPADPVRCRSEENSSVAWIDTAEICQKSSEPWFCERIYSKLCAIVEERYPPEESTL